MSDNREDNSVASYITSDTHHAHVAGSLLYPDEGASLRFEYFRRRTFNNWSVRPINVNLMARQGLYQFPNTTDIVKCYYCSIVLVDFEEGDDVLYEHYTRSKECSLISGKTTDNIPDDQNQLNYMLHSVNSNVRLTVNGPFAISTLNALNYRYSLRNIRFNRRRRRARMFGDSVERNQPRMHNDEENAILTSLAESLPPISGASQSELPSEEPHSSTSSFPSSMSETVQNGNAKDASKCKICFENKLDIIFLPCRHIVACSTCRTQLSDCPACRCPIENVLKIFLM